LARRDTQRVSLTRPSLRACPDCGQVQLVPALAVGASASCLRCDATLRRHRRDPIDPTLAFSLSALVLLTIAASATLLRVSNAGQNHTADLFSGPIGLEHDGMWELAVVVLIATVGAPFAKLGFTLYVLLALRLARPPRHIRTVFAWAMRLRPWSMIEVYLLGVFVACVKLGALVRIEVGVALYALGGLLLAMVAADAMLDRQAVWEEMERCGVPHGPIDDAATIAAAPRGTAIGTGSGGADSVGPGSVATGTIEASTVGARAIGARAIGCHTCGLVSIVPDTARMRCPRCGSVLHARTRDSILCTWALSLAALALYVPANVYPVLTVIQLGAGQPSTILGGVRELISAGMWPLALLVFVASIAVPVVKLISLGILLISTQQHSKWRLRDRTILYRLIEGIGRWSMIDVFMISILVALVQFGALVSINPGPGAIAFAAVVILTMFAAETFDPRLMWDAAANPKVQQ
jgi:paraquat-inducible protein A